MIPEYAVRVCTTEPIKCVYTWPKGTRTEWFFRRASAVMSKPRPWQLWSWCSSSRLHLGLAEPLRSSACSKTKTIIFSSTLCSSPFCVREKCCNLNYFFSVRFTISLCFPQYFFITPPQKCPVMVTQRFLFFPNGNTPFSLQVFSLGTFSRE